MNGWGITGLALAGVIGGLVRGLAGFGGPLLLIPATNLFFPPTVTVPAVLLADTIASLQLVPDAWRRSRPRVLAPLLLGTALAMPAGAALLLRADAANMKHVISAIILLLAIVLLLGWRYRRPLTRARLAGIGALAGLVMGATGIAAVMPLFLTAGHDTAVENRAHFVVWVLAASALLCAFLFAAERTPLAALHTALILLPTYAAGVFVGSRMVRRVSEAALRRLVLCLVLAISATGLIL